jgi:ribose 5-phosphate isomerase B
MPLNVAVGSDHHGTVMRIKIVDHLRRQGHTVIEFGPSPDEVQAVDYPDIASAVASRVSSGESHYGILVCGTGIGMCIVANKFVGVRAAPVIDEISAELSRRHNDLNVLCLSGDLLGEDAVGRIVDLWINTPFDGGRHEKRLTKIADIEKDIRGA